MGTCVLVKKDWIFEITAVSRKIAVNNGHKRMNALFRVAKQGVGLEVARHITLRSFEKYAPRAKGALR